MNTQYYGLNIIPRKIRFEFSKPLPKHWYQGCPVKSNIFNAISILTPAFERLAISSVGHYQEIIKDERLNHELKQFILQEGSHGSGFIRFNTYLKRNGYPVKKLESCNLKPFLLIAKLFSPKTHLAFACASEHLTAVFSDITLSTPLFADIDKGIQKLWYWHAIEEIEHKSVAFDVYTVVGGGYVRRVLAMLFVSFAYFLFVSFNTVILLLKDRKLFCFNTIKQFFSFAFIKEKFILKMCKGYLSFFIPWFHPWQEDNRALLRKWLDTLG